MRCLCLCLYIVFPDEFVELLHLYLVSLPKCIQITFSINIQKLKRTYRIKYEKTTMKMYSNEYRKSKTHFLSFFNQHIASLTTSNVQEMEMRRKNMMMIIRYIKTIPGRKQPRRNLRAPLCSSLTQTSLLLGFYGFAWVHKFLLFFPIQGISVYNLRTKSESPREKQGLILFEFRMQE
jgi:hypothetical protein